MGKRQRLNASALDTVLAGFRELVTQPYAGDAFRILAGARIRIAVLSNGAAATTQKLLDAAGLSPMVERVISVADIRKWKPRPEIYLHTAATLAVAPAKLALVATHAWDVYGAKCARLGAGFMAWGQPYPPMMRAPDVVGETLSDVARAIVALPRG
jgi:2-haloacid dehalogenase